VIHPLGAGDLIYILSAARWTLLLSVLAIFGGGLIGLLLVGLRLSPVRPLTWATVAYIQLFQATPPLMQLFLVYYGGSYFGFSFAAWTAALIAFGLYSSAYLADIWHGCISAVPRDQWEGSRALAFNEPHTVMLVIAPQALKISVPPTIGFLVQLIKTTSVASIIGFVELIRAGQFVNNATLRPLIVYGFVACIYFALCWPLSFSSSRLESRLSRGFRRDQVGIAAGA
jgi:polar amino acid transport system permease protein